MKKISDQNIYNSGLNWADWWSLRNALWPFIHAAKPSEVAIPSVPEHLVNHPVLELLQKYRETEDKAFLDEAGRYLAPTDQPFGWYLALTK